MATIAKWLIRRSTASTQEGRVATINRPSRAADAFIAPATLSGSFVMATAVDSKDEARILVSNKTKKWRLERTTQTKIPISSRHRAE